MPEESTDAFVRLNRKFFRNFLWNEERVYSRAEAWLDLVQSCTYESQKRLVLGELVEIPRGGVIASERFLAVRWQWSRTKVRAFLDVLLAEKMVEKPPKNHRNTVLLLCNFEKYNPRKDHGSDQRGTTEEPAGNQIKERKEGKEPKKSLSRTEPVPAASVATSQVISLNTDDHDDLWRAHAWAEMSPEESLARLSELFPGIDIAGEYRRYCELRSRQGQKPTWRPFLGWLRKATPVVQLARKAPSSSRSGPTRPSAEDWAAFIADEYPDARDPGPARDAPESLLREFATWHARRKAPSP